MPRFARRFPPAATVVNVGAGKFPYRDAFVCNLITADKRKGAADQCWALEDCPWASASVDGVLLFGVFERLDDPIAALREVRRILKVGGLLLFGAPGVGFPVKVERDRWRLTPGGVAHVLQGFDVLEQITIAPEAFYLALARKTPTTFSG